MIDSAAQQRGFLPYDYRLANTFESIRQQRIKYNPSPRASPVGNRIPYRTSPRFDAFGNITSNMSKLAENRLILRENSLKKWQNPSQSHDKQEKSAILSDADFATDIPNALDLILKNTKEKFSVELNLLETLKRERLHQARYRLLPVSRAPCA